LGIHEVQAPREEDLDSQAIISTNSIYMEVFLSQAYAIKLVGSMPRRCQAINNNGGNWITYQ